MRKPFCDGALGGQGDVADGVSLGIINNEADRMSFLVRDLLQLSRFDNRPGRVLSLSRVFVDELYKPKT